MLQNGTCYCSIKWIVSKNIEKRFFVLFAKKKQTKKTNTIYLIIFQKHVGKECISNKQNKLLTASMFSACGLT